MEDCKYAIRKQRGITEWFECELSKDICPFARRCPTLNKVVSSQGSLSCRIKLQKEQQ